jgi:uncharacterized protein
MVVLPVQVPVVGEQQFDMKNALIVFVKNLQAGKVKTRLAATLGEDKALRIYQYLLSFTYQTINSASADKFVFYSEYVNENDIHSYASRLQSGENLGERMQNAFIEIFKIGYQKAVIIGSDSLEITSDLINEAFAFLDDQDVVIGPARDGGYYLLGMKCLNKELFEDIHWSSPSVFKSTLDKVTRKGLSHRKLKELGDIDEEQDWLLYESRVGL